MRAKCSLSQEETPFIIDPETSIKYYQLEQIFNSFFPNDSLKIAKEKSKEERDSKRINDSSFTYGEVVITYINIENTTFENARITIENFSSLISINAYQNGFSNFPNYIDCLNKSIFICQFYKKAG